MARVGADLEGTEPINGLLEEHAGDDTLLYFPKGTYLMGGAWEKREFENFGIVGDQAVIRPPDGYRGYLFSIGWSDRAIDFLFKGITFDVTAPKTGVRPLHATLQDGLYVSDIAVRGITDVHQDLMRFDVTRSDGEGLVENLRLPDGGVARYPLTGVYVGEVSEGTLTFRDCYVAGFPDNGLYASQARGPVRVIGGRYENNNVANVRVSGGALVRGVTVRATADRDLFGNVRGIRLRSGRDIVVEDCVVDFRKVNRSDGAITMHNWLESATIRNTDIRIDTDDVHAILAKEPNWDVNESDSNIHIENVRITGEAANSSAIEIVERNDVQLTNLCIQQTGPRRDGIRLYQSNGGTLRDSTISVTGDPIVLEEATLDRTAVRVDRVSPAVGVSRACPRSDRSV